MRIFGLFTILVVMVMVMHKPSARSADFYGDADAVLIERDGKVVGRLPAKRIPLKYPELAARAEVNAALDSKGNIWAAIGYNTGAGGAPASGVERLFCSRDGGRTWTSQPVPMSEQRNIMAFTVLKDDEFLLITSPSLSKPPSRTVVEVYVSNDLGKTWQQTSKIKSDPFKNIGEGFQSLTRLADGSVLFPVSRWTSDYVAGGKRENVVFRSIDGGKTWGDRSPTYDSVAEPHIIQLKSGKLLGAFRYQRHRRAGETAVQIKALGGDPTKAVGALLFKHVFIGSSEDGGRTWRNLHPVRDRQRRPLLLFGETHGQLVQVSDGRVVLVNDRRYPYERYEVRARLSRDGGRTWEPEIYHLSFGAGYPASVALPDGTIVTITGNTPFTPAAQPIGKWRAQVIRWRLPGKPP